MDSADGRVRAQPQRAVAEDAAEEAGGPAVGALRLPKDADVETGRADAESQHAGRAGAEARHAVAGVGVAKDAGAVGDGEPAPGPLLAADAIGNAWERRVRDAPNTGAGGAVGLAADAGVVAGGGVGQAPHSAARCAGGLAKDTRARAGGGAVGAAEGEAAGKGAADVERVREVAGLDGHPGGRRAVAEEEGPDWADGAAREGAGGARS